jgi:ATP/maltotriose-dependent transcriptional regulator MalT
MRETADRRIEGSELRSLGELFLAQGDLDQARVRFAQAEAVLREVDDKLYLALVLCGRGEVQLRSGDADGARSMLAEARRLAAETGMGPASMLGRRIAALAAQFV